MSSQRNQNQRRRSGRQRPDARRQSTRRRPPRRKGFDLSRLLSQLLSRRPKADFKPDAQESTLLKVLHLTQAQRDLLIRWGLIVVLLVGLCMLQDVIMSRITLFGGTTDLAVGAILLITVMLGMETGCLFSLIAGCLYYFSGTSPGPVCVGLITFLGIGACLFRQMYWHRNRASIVLCAGLATLLYELGVFAVGVFTGLTRWDRILVFVVTAGLTVAVMIPLYSLINVIGQIGGNTWKE